MEYKAEVMYDMSPESVDEHSKSFKGYVNCIRAVLPQMRLQKHGSIINITSIGSIMKNPFWPYMGHIRRA